MVGCRSGRLNQNNLLSGPVSVFLCVCFFGVVVFLDTKVRASPATRLFVFCLVYTNTSLYCVVAITKEVFPKTSLCQGETRPASARFQFHSEILT